MKTIWTIDALKQYIDQRFQASEHAIELATSVLDSRLEGMNNFRAEITSERAELLTKDAYERAHDALEQRVIAGEDKLEVRLGVLERWQAKIIGAMAIVVFVTPLLTGLVVWYVTHHHAP